MRREYRTKLYKVVDDPTADRPTYVVLEMLARVTDKLVQLDKSYPGIAGVRWERQSRRPHLPDPIGRYFHLTRARAVVAFNREQRALADSLARQLAKAERAARWAITAESDAVLSDAEDTIPCHACEGERVTRDSMECRYCSGKGYVRK